MARYWSMTYRKPTLVGETELLALAKDMPAKSTIKARLRIIDYTDMKAAAETLGGEYHYSCHGDIFEISRNAKEL